MQNKTFDPRSAKVTNPFVQAYIEKQAEKAKPIGDRQKIVNILFSAVLAVNVAVLGMVVWTSRTTIVPELTGVETPADTAMGEAMQKIKQLEINLQNMRSSVEYHKNAYFKLEQEHETMKATLARSVSTDNPKDVSMNYVLPVPPNAAVAAPGTDASPTVSVTAPVREHSVAAQLAVPVQGQ